MCHSMVNYNGYGSPIGHRTALILLSTGQEQPKMELVGIIVMFPTVHHKLTGLPFSLHARQ
jgi:hypothetical protein